MVCVYRPLGIIGETRGVHQTCYNYYVQERINKSIL